MNNWREWQVSEVYIYIVKNSNKLIDYCRWSGLETNFFSLVAYIVASERFGFTSQNKFSLARLTLCSICLIFSRVNYCKHASL